MKNKKFNLFDLLIILLVLGIVAAVIFRSQITETIFGGSKQKYEVTIEVAAFSNEGIASLAEGSLLYVHGNSMPFGKISSPVEITPVTETVVVGAEEIDAVSSYFSSLKITLEVEGHVAEDVYYAKNGSALLVKNVFSLENENVCFEGKVVSVAVVSDN